MLGISSWRANPAAQQAAVSAIRDIKVRYGEAELDRRHARAHNLPESAGRAREDQRTLSYELSRARGAYNRASGFWQQTLFRPVMLLQRRLATRVQIRTAKGGFVV
jgi:hypothetical protein